MTPEPEPQSTVELLGERPIRSERPTTPTDPPVAPVQAPTAPPVPAIQRAATAPQPPSAGSGPAPSQAFVPVQRASDPVRSGARPLAPPTLLWPPPPVAASAAAPPMSVRPVPAPGLKRRVDTAHPPTDPAPAVQRAVTAPVAWTAVAARVQPRRRPHAIHRRTGRCRTPARPGIGLPTSRRRRRSPGTCPPRRSIRRLVQRRSCSGAPPPSRRRSGVAAGTELAEHPDVRGDAHQGQIPPPAKDVLRHHATSTTSSDADEAGRAGHRSPRY